MKQELSQERRQAIQLALGRIFRMGSRPFREGDIQDYELCRSIILNEGSEYDPHGLRA